jgi:hypothetical protein
MIRFTIPSFCAALLALVAAVPAVAQTSTQTRQALRVDNYGVPFFAGGSTSQRLDTSMSISPLSTRRAAVAENKSSIHLFGVTAEAAAVRMSLSAQRDIIGFSTTGAPITRNTSLGAFQVRIAGATVLSQTAVNTPVLGTISGNAFAGVSPSYQVSLFGIGYSIRGSATARADWNLTNTISFAAGVSVNMSGPLRCRATGSSSVVLSVLGASAGVTSTLTYADTNANLNVSVLPTGAVGGITWSVALIRLRMQAWASVLGILNTQMLFDFNLPAISGTTALRTL